MLRNTTNIPDRLVAIMLAFVLKDECFNGIEPPSCVTVKNKARGKFNGRWGWYYPSDRHTIVIVPRRISTVRNVFRKYSRRRIIIRNRSDFLVCILAHELRHHYQEIAWNNPRASWRLRRDRVAKIAREVDAEIFESQILERWHKFTCEVSLADI